MNPHIPAGWTITRGTSSVGDYIDIVPPEGEHHDARIYRDALHPGPVVYRLASALLEAPAAPQAETMPSWMTYSHTTDVLTIHGRRYAASMFGQTGFLSPPGTLLRVEHGPADVVTVTTAPQPPAEPRFDLIAHLEHQREFSLRTFGPGDRTAGVCDHIRKELREVEDDAAAGIDTLPEWVDVIILAFDGAHRTGASPQAIVDAIVAKQTKNEARRWPDWRTAEPGKAIEHDRSGEPQGGAHG
jgi:hypothetical protein